MKLCKKITAVSIVMFVHFKNQEDADTGFFMTKEPVKTTLYLEFLEILKCIIFTV